MAAARPLGLLFLVLIFQIFIPLAACSECKIDLEKHYNLRSPMFLDKSCSSVVYPVSSTPRQLSFAPNTDHILLCLGGQLTRSNISYPAVYSTSRCQSNHTFVDLSSSTTYQIHEVGCSQTPEPTSNEIDACAVNGQSGVRVELGYRLPNKRFMPIFELCHVKGLASTSWAHATLRSILMGMKWKEKSTSFTKGAYFANVKISEVYPKTQQRLRFLDIFANDSVIVDRYIPPSNDSAIRNYLVKGHLVARADLFYPAEQHSTYFYVNALPMWESINNGNWKSVESQSRRLAAVHGDYDVWVGGIGTLKLDNRDIYLTTDRKNSSRPLMPVPRMLFKMLVRERTAVVFVTVNNPYVGVVGKEYQLCKEHEACKQFTKFKQLREGYTYCCSYQDFMANDEVKRINLPVQVRNPKMVEFK